MGKKGVLNLQWEQAAAIARESGNETPANIKRILREFKSVEQAGYTADMAIACWRWLRVREEFPIVEARIITTLKGSPVYIEQFKTMLLQNMPPVYEADAHDRYVLKYAKELTILGFKYRAENLPLRLTTNTLIRIGLKQEEEYGHPSRVI